MFHFKDHSIKCSPFVHPNMIITDGLTVT